eukprot:5461662-Amphidinium_carterae.1
MVKTQEREKVGIRKPRSPQAIWPELAFPWRLRSIQKKHEAQDVKEAARNSVIVAAQAHEEQPSATEMNRDVASVFVFVVRVHVFTEEFNVELDCGSERSTRRKRSYNIQ